MSTSERWASDRLYQFALYFPVPTVERFALTIIASQWGSGRVERVENKEFWATLEWIETACNLSRSAASQVVRSLLKSGIVEQANRRDGATVYGITPSLPALYEHRCSALSLEMMTGSSLEKLHVEMDFASDEIKKYISTDAMSLLEMRELRATLYEAVSRWRQIEINRALMRSLQANQFEVRMET